jgi:hypothetical protein
MQRIRDQREASRQDTPNDLSNSQYPVGPDGDAHPTVTRGGVKMGMIVMMSHASS